MKKKIVVVALILLIVSIAYAATKSLVPRADSEGGLGTSSKWWLEAYIDTVFTKVLTLSDQDASPDAVGELQYDNTVTGLDDGAWCWYDDDEVKYFVDLATLPTNDDYVVAYDAAIDKFYMKADTTIGLGVAANGEIPIGDGAGDPTLATISEGLCVDVTNGAGSITVAWDPTELTGNRSWNDGTTDAAFIWTFNVNTGTDPTIAFTNNDISFGCPIRESNNDIWNRTEAATWDALHTFNLGVTITTGDPFTLGTNRIDDGSDKINGAMIGDETVDSAQYAADSVDNKHINWADMNNLADDGLIVVADTADATSFVALWESATGNLAAKSDAALTYAADTGTLAATQFSGGGGSLTGVDAATGDSATAFFDAGTIEHERGGLEADVSSYTGLLAITGGNTAEVDAKSELEGHIADVNNFAEADGDTFTGVHDFGGVTTIVPWKVNATAAPTVEGQAIWESDTDELTVGDGTNSIVVAAKIGRVYAFNVKDITAAFDDIKIPLVRATTITKVTAYVTGGTNVVGRLYEVDGDGDDADAVGVESSDWTFTAGETEDSSFNNATFDAGDYIQWDTTSVSGSVTGFMICVWGYEI